MFDPDEYRKEIAELSLVERAKMICVLEDSIAAEEADISEETDALHLKIVKQRMENLKLGHAELIGWNDIKQELSHPS